MSRIQIKATYASQHPITVVFGWDRPLQHCFLDIDVDDIFEAEEDEDAIAQGPFGKLVDVALNTHMQGMCVESVRAALAAAELVVPEAAFDELCQHRDLNLGNHIVEFDETGTRKVLYADPAARA